MRSPKPLRAAAFAVLATLLGSAAAHAAGPITSGSVYAGTLSSPTYTESWTFSGSNGDRVIVAALATSGAVSTQIVLRAPGGAVMVNTGQDRFDHQLTANGTWTIEISDGGLNDAGTYTLAMTNVTAGPHTNGSDLDGGAIASNEIRAGGSGTVADFDAYTFVGTAGQRVVATAVETVVSSYNTTMYLYPPGGGVPEISTSAGNRLDHQLAATGTYTLVVEEFGNDHTGTYTMSFVNLTAGPLTDGGDPDGGAIVSNQPRAGTMSGIGDVDAYTFAGNTGQRVIVAGVTTSGSLATQVALYPPNGGAPVVFTGQDRFEHQLTANGTWTIVVEDGGNDVSGGYTLGFVNVSGGPLTDGTDTNGGAIASNEIRAGGSGTVADFDAYTFVGTAGQRVVATAVETVVSSYNTTLYLYPPGGGAPETSTSGGNRLDHQLAATGTYTLVVEEFGNDHTGTYTMSFVNLTAGPLTDGGDPDGGAIVSNQPLAGTMSGIGDVDAYTFAGNTGQRVIVAGVATSGSLATQVALYPPNGGAPVVFTGQDRFEHQLTANGTWTIVVEDGGNDVSGGYTLGFVNVTGGPLTDGTDTNGGAIASNEIRAGGSGTVADFDAYTFVGTAGQRVVATAVETVVSSYNTTLYLYPPGGGAPETSTSGGNRLDHQLAATGTYTLVVEEFGNDHTGTYTMSFVNLTAGPLTDGGDPDGGAIVSNQPLAGTMSGVGDVDAYTFAGNTGQRVIVAGVTTSGSLATQVALYPPNGGAPVVFTGQDRFEHQLTANGTWTIVVEDGGNDVSGGYTLGFVNVSGGPLTDGTDTNGGAIASNEIRTGGSGTVADFDAYTFVGTAGHRVVATAVETVVSSYNTTLYLYPPGGGAAVTSTSGGNRLDHQLAATGTYTLVVEEFGNDHTGTYTMSFVNLTAGPLTDGGDPDGGAIVSNQPRAGTMSGVGDVDAYTFAGNTGQRVIVAGVATSGSLATQVALYPPNGAAPVVFTGQDRFDHQLTANGTWTIVMEDGGNDEAGGYTLGLLEATAGPLVDEFDGDGGPIVSAELRSGTTGTVVDFDGYAFEGAAGQRVLFTAVETAGGPHNTTMYLYPPGGGAAVTSTSGGNRLDHQLAATGTYTLVVEDFGNDHIGAFNICFVNLTAGFYTTGTDPDGGLVEPGDVRNGQVSPLGDLDVYSFHGVSGETAQISAVGSGGAFGTQIVIYPPGGGSAAVNTGSDNVNYLLTTTGYHAISIEDGSSDGTGSYTFTLNGTLTTVDVPGPESAPLDPVRVVLKPAYPNPFRGGASITWSLPAKATARLRIYDLRGAVVRTLADGAFEPGVRVASWDGRRDDGEPVGAGVYFAQLQVGSELLRHKLVCMR